MSTLKSRRRFLIEGAGAIVSAPLMASAKVRGESGPQPDGIAETIAAGRGAISASNPDAAQAGLDVLRKGGNAVDAAIAAFMVQTVREPGNTGLGGYGGAMIIHQASTGKTHALDFDSRVPLAFKPELYKTENDHIHGYLAAGVPGNAAGFDLALREFGSWNWTQASAYAVRLAENGFLVDAQHARGFARAASKMEPISHRAYFPLGVPKEGDHFKQTDLAKLYKRLGAEGPRSFYRGEIAAIIARQVQQNGGILSEQDLRLYEATTASPLRIEYRGFQIETPPPPASGLTVLSVLKTLEQFDLSGFQPASAEFFDLYLKAFRVCWAERVQFFGDPDFVAVPAEELLTEERARKRAEQIRANVLPQQATLEHSGPKHTCNVTSADAAGNFASITATHGDDFGSRVVIDGLGLVLGHGLSRFSWQPGTPNYPEPGKRVYHNMCPVLISRNGKPVAALGLPGGQMIVSVTAQLVFSLIDFHATALEAVTAPRVHRTASEPVLVSANLSEAAKSALCSKGYQLRAGRVGGFANVVRIDPATGLYDVATDAGTGSFLSL